MNEPSELEKLNAVAQSEANARSFRSLRWKSLFILAPIAMAGVHGGTPLQNLLVLSLAVMVVSAVLSIWFGWRYAPALEQSLWSLVFAAGAIFVAGEVRVDSNSWVEILCLVAMVAGFVEGAIESIRTTRVIRLASSPSCAQQHEIIDKWMSQLTSESHLPSVIQFIADDFWTDGRVIVRLLQQDGWIVAATLVENDSTKILTLSIFDARCTKVLSSPERKRLRIGDRKFCKVEFTPELAALTGQLEHGNASV